MRVLIIEDEPLAAARLEELVLQYDPSVTIAGKCDSVKESVRWLGSNALPDLLFLDVQLGDGLSFDILDQVKLDCPVIFTTAFDAYAIDAFRLNSISYLLKPIKQEELAAAIDKYKASPYFLLEGQNSDNQISGSQDSDSQDSRGQDSGSQDSRSQDSGSQFSGSRVPGIQQQAALDMVRQLLTSQYKKRFLVKTGQHIRSVATEEILCFYSMEKATYAAVLGGKTVLMDYTLEQIEGLLDPGKFFRISRKYIVSVDAIDDIITYSGSRLKLRIRNCPDNDIFVSRERVQEFKEWLNR